MPQTPPLHDGETILWEGRPDTRPRFGIETVATGIFAGALVLAALGLATVIDRSEPGLFWPILLPGLILGAVIVLAYPLFDSAQNRGTRYVLTNQRALIIGRKNPHRTAHDREGYPIPAPDALIYQAGNPPSIYFGRRSTSKHSYTDVGFERISDANDVYPVMRDLAEAQIRNG
ncbi:hypothetical protein [Yoonia sp. 208BN28-4]|uniref:hypothetical protein n=1 Tax=Yoonia sp. 208BN28-4 TaxID=3126505 RepID=UPI0030AE176B